LLNRSMNVHFLVFAEDRLFASLSLYVGLAEKVYAVEKRGYTA
jgi:hypothetical protein